MNRRALIRTLSGLTTVVIVVSLLLGAGSVAAKETSSSPLKSSATAAGQPQGQPTAVAHVTRDGVVIEQGGIQVELPVNEMPDDAVVAGIDLKVSVAGAPVDGLQVQVAAPDGALVQIPLQPVAADHGDGAKHTPDSAGAQVGIARTATTFHQMDGESGLGAWTVRLVPTDAALVGKAAGISLVVQYTTKTAWPVQSENSGGHPAMRSLPAPIWELSTPTTEDRDQKPAAPSGGSVSPSAWQTIKYEDFEGNFPNSGWTVIDQSNDGFERFWDDDDYKPYGGSWSAWPANGGANGLDPQFYYYPNNMDTWMVYGPFDLSNATDAQTVFRLWREIEPTFDLLFFGVSANGANFTGMAWDGYVGWTEYTVGYGAWVGDSSVWVGWQFISDGSIQYDGPFVDNISIQKNVSTNCGPFAEAGGWAIPDDGRWLAVPLTDRMAPATGAVSEVNVKYLFNHADPSQLEVKLAKAGSAVEQILWNRGELVAGDKLGSALGLSAFNGTPAPGDWQLLVRDVVPGEEGRLAAASVRARYTPLGPAPTVVQGPAGQFSALSLPADARRTSAPDAEKPASDLALSAPDQPAGWEVIKSEGFESAFPNAGWTLFDLSNDGCDFLWDDDDYKPHVGNYAGWPANGGANSLDPAVSNYPPNMNSWMVYGPFSLAGATDADTFFSLWREIEPTFDWAAFGVSADGTNFNVVQWDGAANWADLQVNYQSYVGDASIWVAWIFHSDASIQYDGPWVDEISIRKYVPVNCGPFAVYDFNSDGVIDIQDIAAVASRWMDPTRYDIRYDVSPAGAPNGVIDIGDIAAVAVRFGQTCP